MHLQTFLSKLYLQFLQSLNKFFLLSFQTCLVLELGLLDVNLTFLLLPLTPCCFAKYLLIINKFIFIIRMETNSIVIIGITWIIIKICSWIIWQWTFTSLTLVSLGSGKFLNLFSFFVLPTVLLSLCLTLIKMQVLFQSLPSHHNFSKFSSFDLGSRRIFTAP